MLDLRSVFDELRIEWRDRGKNCSRGRINIACPFCGDDPSEHMSIDESEERYYCWRCTSGGTSFARLFTRLGVGYLDVPGLLNRHNTDATPVVKTPSKPQSAIIKAWQRFEPAADSDACTNYLFGRGFTTPVATCRQYDLRFSRAGTWAQRLLIPVMENGEVVTWIGRSLRNNIEPKYLLEPCDHVVIYTPRAPRDVLVIVEGSLDALKVAVATAADSVSSVALLGKGFAPEKISKITALASNVRYILVALDADVSIVTVHTIVHEIASQVRCPVAQLVIPQDYHDPCDMGLEICRAFLTDAISAGLMDRNGIGRS